MNVTSSPAITVIRSVLASEMEERTETGHRGGFLGERRNSGVAHLCVPEPMVSSACVLSGDSVRAAALVGALQEAVGALSLVRGSRRGPTGVGRPGNLTSKSWSP